MRARAVPALAAAALALAGCGGGTGSVPQQTRAPIEALSYGEAIADLDVQLAGVARAHGTREAADHLWELAVRTGGELPKHLDASGPVGGRLLTAVEEARFAAVALHGGRSPEAEAHLRRSAAALSAAADAISPSLPRSAAPDLERLRAALP
jgi:hypothetical protein